MQFANNKYRPILSYIRPIVMQMRQMIHKARPLSLERALQCQ